MFTFLSFYFGRIIYGQNFDFFQTLACYLFLLYLYPDFSLLFLPGCHTFSISGLQEGSKKLDDCRSSLDTPSIFPFYLKTHMCRTRTSDTFLHVSACIGHPCLDNKVLLGNFLCCDLTYSWSYFCSVPKGDICKVSAFCPSSKVRSKKPSPV